MLLTVRGKKSRTASPLPAATVDKTLVSSMPKTTAPLAKRAILPVSSEITREPTSNSSLNDSRNLVPATGGSDSDVAKPKRPQHILRKRRARHVASGLALARALMASEDIAIGIWMKKGVCVFFFCVGLGFKEPESGLWWQNVEGFKVRFGVSRCILPF